MTNLNPSGHEPLSLSSLLIVQAVTRTSIKCSRLRLSLPTSSSSSLFTHSLPLLTASFSSFPSSPYTYRRLLPPATLYTQRIPSFQLTGSDCPLAPPIPPLCLSYSPRWLSLWPSHRECLRPAPTPVPANPGVYQGYPLNE